MAVGEQIAVGREEHARALPAVAHAAGCNARDRGPDKLEGARHAFGIGIKGFGSVARNRHEAEMHSRNAAPTRTFGRARPPHPADGARPSRDCTLRAYLGTEESQ